MEGPGLGDARIMALQRRSLWLSGERDPSGGGRARAICSQPMAERNDGDHLLRLVDLDHDLLVLAARRCSACGAGHARHEGLYGIVWETKVERQGQGTRLAAAKVSMSGEDWMGDGWSAAAFTMDDHEGAGAGP